MSFRAFDTEKQIMLLIDALCPTHAEVLDKLQIAYFTFRIIDIMNWFRGPLRVLYYTRDTAFAVQSGT